MGSCCGIDSVDEQRRLLEEEERNRVQPPPRQVQVALEVVNVVDVPLPTIYYVIVGRGPMAVVNHRTLLETEWGTARIGGHRVVHIGAPNPWPRYLRHGLGQPNHLLSFPGLVNQPSQGGETIDGGLDSRHFGTRFNTEFEGLDPAPLVFEEWVGLIQARAAPNAGALDARIRDEDEIDGTAVRTVLAEQAALPWPDFAPDRAPYRLCLYNPANGTARLVYAAAIDICTGPGRPVVRPPGGNETDEIRRARTPPWLPPERWALEEEWLGRRTLNGVDAIRTEVEWNEGERVCVTAGGGVGLNAAEKARNRNCALDWFGREALMPIFDNPRNITFLRRPGGDAACEPGPRAAAGINNEDDLIPSHRRLRMGRGVTLFSATDVEGAVEVRLAGPNTARIRDWWRTLSPLDAPANESTFWTFSDHYINELQPLGIVASVRYDRLVIPNGQATDQPGHPNSFAHHLGFEAHEQADRLVCLQTANGLVRILGAACNNYPGFVIGTYRANQPVVTPAQRMWAYHATLPVSAVPDGFIVCGANTALANRYFAAHPNTNVNTMTHAELLAIVGEARATRIVERRRASNGYLDRNDLLLRCGFEDHDSLAGLTYAYPAIVV